MSSDDEITTRKHFDQENTPFVLTARQSEVLALLGRGNSNKEIACVLQVAEGTIKLHVSAILRALNVNNRTRAAIVAARMGLFAARAPVTRRTA